MITVEYLIRCGVKAAVAWNSGSQFASNLRKNRKWTFIRKPLEDRFWSKIKRGKSHECWPWIANKNRSGYGMIYADGDQFYATRVAYIIRNGPIENRQFVLHKCDNPACCNPKHLFLGSAADNMTDCIKKNRHWVKHGDQHYNSKLTQPQVIEIRKRNPQWKDRPKVAKEYGISLSHLNALLNRTRWGWLK